MIRAVIFAMFETLITHYESPLYFGAQIAKDTGIQEDKFFLLWRDAELEYQRTVGQMTLEQVLEIILKENHCYYEQGIQKPDKEIFRRCMEVYL